jgi:hypothetical protein
MWVATVGPCCCNGGKTGKPRFLLHRILLISVLLGVSGGFGMMGALSGLCSIDILRKPTQAYISIQESENMDSPFSFLKYFFNFEKSPFQV